eukprot:3754391-Rhodomonas_salina.2
MRVKYVRAMCTGMLAQSVENRYVSFTYDGRDICVGNAGDETGGGGAQEGSYAILHAEGHRRSWLKRVSKELPPEETSQFRGREWAMAAASEKTPLLASDGKKVGATAADTRAMRCAVLTWRVAGGGQSRSRGRDQCCRWRTRLGSLRTNGGSERRYTSSATASQPLSD